MSSDETGETEPLLDGAPNLAPVADDRESSCATSVELSNLSQRARRQVMAPGLYIVATPIGNLADITVRAADILARADHIYCEDTRLTQRLLDALGLRRALRTYHEHNGEEQRPRILDGLARGQTIALVSDAGTPLISDPGYKLVRDARLSGHPVVALPGPSALTAALSVAGLPTSTVLFVGFLPPKQQARRDRLAALAEISATLVAYESPNRLAAMLQDAAVTLGQREVVVARELTKKFEEIRAGTIAELAAWAETSDIKGEIVVVFGPPVPVDAGCVSDGTIKAALEDLLTTMKLSAAAKDVSRRLGVPRARVYEIAVQLKSASDDEV